MAVAQPITEIAMTTAPTSTPVWVDVSQYVEGWSFTRGRQSELDAVKAGSYRGILRNRDRRFDPAYTAGPYYGNLKRMRRLRQRARIDGVTYDLFHGYIRGWPQRVTSDGEQFVPITADDGFRVLAMADVSGSFDLERTDERVAAILAAANWQTGTPWILGDPTYGVLGTTTILGPLGDQALDIGLSQVQAVVLATVNALGHLQDIERSENGLLFINRQGGVTFHNRQRRLLAGSQSPLAIFGDDETVGELPYASCEVTYDDTFLWNDARITRTGGTEQQTEDAASITDHFRRTLTRNVLVPTDSESAVIASYLVRLYKDPPSRIEGMVLDPHFNVPGLWERFLSSELGDVVLVRQRPFGGGNVVEQQSVVESIHVEWDTAMGLWRGDWRLSPADETPYWVLGESALGVSTALAF